MANCLKKESQFGKLLEMKEKIMFTRSLADLDINTQLRYVCPTFLLLIHLAVVVVVWHSRQQQRDKTKKREKENISEILLFIFATWE